MTCAADLAEVRLNIGNSTTPTDQVIESKLLSFYAKGLSQEEAVYQATLYSLRILIANTASSSSASASKQIVGDVEVESNSSSGSSSVDSIRDLYQFWLDNPPDGVSVAGFIIGGVSQSRRDDICNDSDIVGPRVTRNFLESEEDLELIGSIDDSYV